MDLDFKISQSKTNGRAYESQILHYLERVIQGHVKKESRDFMTIVIIIIINKPTVKQI